MKQISNKKHENKFIISIVLQNDENRSPIKI